MDKAAEKGVYTGLRTKRRRSRDPEFSSLLEQVNQSLDPITRRLGWSTNLELKPFLDEAAFTAYKAYRYSRSSLYTVVVGTNDKDEGPPTHATESPTPSSPGAQQTA